jgi:hypothetical protein
MTEDKSRERSLLFLLSTVARSLEASSESKKIIREAISSLKIQNSEEKWIISVMLPNKSEKSIEMGKDQFIFYPVKSAARYETNPAILNRNSAEDALLTMFNEYGVRVPGKKHEPRKRQLTDFLPLNLILVAVFALLSTFNLKPFSSLLIISHLILSTANHHFSALKRWILITSVVLPAIGFLILYKSDSKEIVSIICQFVVLLMFDLAIRYELELKSKLGIAAKYLFLGLISTAVLNAIIQIKLTSLFLVLIAITSFITLRQKISASFRNILVLFNLGLLIALVAILVMANPLKLLLLPYLIYLAIYETLFGENRNPAKLAFGVICLMM